jgi:hypothetical protein
MTSQVSFRCPEEGSKGQFQRELDRSGATDLIERIERTRPKIGSATRTSKALPQHLVCDAELTTVTGEITDWWSEVGMVQNIEHFSAELQLQRLENGKLAMDGKIPLR